MKVSWPRTLLNWREPFALLSSSRSAPQPLKRSFIPAFIAVFGLSSLTHHGTRLNISFPHCFKNLRFHRCCCGSSACRRYNLEEQKQNSTQQQTNSVELYWMNWRDLLSSLLGCRHELNSINLMDSSFHLRTPSAPLMCR